MQFFWFELALLIFLVACLGEAGWLDQVPQGARLFSVPRVSHPLVG